MIRKYQKSDREFMIAMMEDFYSSPAVLHAIPKENYIKTLNEVESNSPFADIFVLESEGERAGYALTAYTYSNEAGGKVSGQGTWQGIYKIYQVVVRRICQDKA